jgi:hypothetical protein
MGIPTIVLGFGGKTFGFNAMNEFWIATNAYRGVQVTFLSTLAMAGVEGVSQPTLVSLSAFVQICTARMSVDLRWPHQDIQG